MATEAASLETIGLLCDLAHTVSIQFEGENYRKTLSEVFFTLSNLVTECDEEHLYKILFAVDPSMFKVHEILAHSIKILE